MLFNPIFCLGTKGGGHKRAHLSRINPKSVLFNAPRSVVELWKQTLAPAPKHGVWITCNSQHTVTVLNHFRKSSVLHDDLAQRKLCGHSVNCDVTWCNMDRSLALGLDFSVNFGARTFYSCQGSCSFHISYETPIEESQPSLKTRDLDLKADGADSFQPESVSNNIFV